MLPDMKPGPAKQFDPETALMAAIEVFGSRGYEAASLTELTAAMGIGKKSLYDTFGNKRSLFLQSLEMYSKVNARALRTRLTEGDSPLKNLKDFLASAQAQHSEPGSKGCLIGTCIADFDTDDEQVAAILNQKLEQLEQIFLDTIKLAQSKDELPQALKPRDIARTLVCITQGAALVGRVQQNGKVIEAAFCTTLELLRRP